MKSNVYTIKRGFVKEQIFTEVEKSARYFDLDRKARLQLRLLTEELTGMMNEIAGKYRAEFWVESDPVEYAVQYWEKVYNVDFRLHLRLEETDLNEESRKQLLSVATTGKNEPPRGIMGKIQAFLEQCSQAHEDLGVYCSQQGRLIPYMGDMYDSCSIQDDSVVWTLNDYAGRLSSGKKGEEWDELEKSILANLADDVVVRIHGRSVEVIVSKAFQKAASGGFQ